MIRWALTILFCGLMAMFSCGQQSPSLLVSYVTRDDGSFSWVREGKTETPLGVTVHELRLTSQKWKDITWQHTLLVVQPSKVMTDTAVLVISGGSTESRGDSQTRLLAATIASQIQAIVAVLFAVPNQPLFEGLTEDNLIAHTFVKVLETGDKEWACLLPMTKSAVKAMDAVQQFAEKELGMKINGFVVTGASKRGWTTWLTAVADPKRVKGIAPIVYDNLNIPAQMKHQKEVFGTYSEQIREYVERGLVDLVVGDGKARELVQLVDPYFYRERLTMPKLVINGTNDRYWALDAANFYFYDLPGEKHILYVPNAGHGLEGGLDRVLRTLSAFFNRVAGRIPFPKLQWQWKDEGQLKTLVIRSQPSPKEVLVWTAKSPTKDFRDAKWSSQFLLASNGDFKFTLKPPEQGYAAAFAEIVYEIDGQRFSLCTTIRIVGK
ncbi:MAG: PhoPQ-activated pathogenicity-related family protein [Armatimonadetes bacterium]|nr:PhoPQ-activated pathogenicity-related family protein [Armatimonadota bacterium]MCX7967535.1 PhoPQ-activated pathogenicity-related family protein [Armatimonadota bacterium]MDW8142946.1 PhoPQ-activated protein PqaA family protein [Armatimonadota bacterium]